MVNSISVRIGSATKICRSTDKPRVVPLSDESLKWMNEFEKKGDAPINSSSSVGKYLT